MNRIAQSMGFVLLTLCLGLALNGCGKSDSQAATETARQFMAAMRNNDAQTAHSLMTKLAREKTGASVKPDTDKNNAAQGEPIFGAAKIEGDAAEVPMTVKQDGRDSQGKLKLRREEGQWRVYALVVETTPGVELTLDFERPETMMGEMMKAMGASMASGMKDLGKGLGEGMRGFAEGFSQGLTNSAPKK